MSVYKAECSRCACSKRSVFFDRKRLMKRGAVAILKVLKNANKKKSERYPIASDYNLRSKKGFRVSINIQTNFL